MQQQNLHGAIVVITGASSGIGRATAFTFARHGARLVLAARRADVLATVAAECEQLGTESLVVPTDVTDSGAVQLLAQAAFAFGGRIDIWVNNAGIGAVGAFNAVPLEAHEQVIRTNLFGYLYGAYAVLPYFQRQQSGMLINVVSLGAWLPEPFTVSYSASKYGLRGLMDTIRTELSGHPNIHVCDVHPSYIDTPGFQHGANYTGRLIKPAPPVFSAQKVADTIVALTQHPRPSTMVGWTGSALRMAYSLMPSVTRRVGLRLMQRYLRQAERVPVTEGSIFSPTPVPHGNDISGGWGSTSGQGSKWLGMALLAGLVAGLYALGQGKSGTDNSGA
ncbi:SDR family oxidoreductase [Hymenobacter terrenus]|uniref:SDR family oxidoreductase n=1 Tax=Hymenobacter terrenus TaxID=1629124 RepID=UPI000619D3BD|nr:SDR family oxidoreductase [Hymenobacter terrenus]